METYEWQKEVIEHKGDITIRGGRQVGKSIAVAHRIVKVAKDYPGCTILITSPSERQENYIYEKVLALFGDRFKFKKKPTMKKCLLTNGTKILKHPVGRTGAYVEGLSSVDFLFVDEAIGMTELSWHAILPMLAEPRKRGLGWITLLSNTRGKAHGYFRESFDDPSFRKFHISAEDCPHIDKEYLAKEKHRLGDILYKMIWLGEFVEFEFKYFSKEILDKVFVLKGWVMRQQYSFNKSYFLGVDPARYGRCASAFVVSEVENGSAKIVHAETIKKSSMTDLFRMVEHLDGLFHFRKIYIDSGGVGAGLFDFLHEKYRNKIRDLNNASKGENGKILKEDLYSNALKLMEQGKLISVRNEELLESLQNIEFDGDKITGDKSDLAEALVRAVWSIKEKVYTPRIV